MERDFRGENESANAIRISCGGLKLTKHVEEKARYSDGK